jgi:hypothetical protein
MQLEATDKVGNSLYKMDYYSVGGGFVETGDSIKSKSSTTNMNSE